MTPDRPPMRRPDGTPYDPSRFNVRQYEEEYGPGGVPEGYSMAAVTPLQSPTAITVVGLVLVILSGLMVFLAVAAAESEPGVSVYSGIMAVVVLGGATWAFIIAGRRRRWLRERAEKARGHVHAKKP
jgi:hypothetical protein